MEKDNQKTKRPYNNSLSEVFMTTEKIAEIWNQKGVGKDEKKEFCVLPKSDGKQDAQWDAERILNLFKSILKKWGLEEYKSCYQSNKSFPLLDNLISFQRRLRLELAPIQFAVRSLLGKEEEAVFEESREKLDEVVTRLDKLPKDNSSSKSFYIFNREAFCMEENVKEDANYSDTLYELYRISKKKLTIGEIEDVSYKLCSLIPIFQSVTQQKEFEIHAKRQESDREYIGKNRFFNRKCAEVDSKQREIMNKLYLYCVNDNDWWHISYNFKGKQNELYEIYRIMLIIMDYVVKKYIFLLSSIEKVRMIEKEMLDYDKSKSGLSVQSIISVYGKAFKYTMDKEMRDKIKLAKNRIDVGDVIEDIRSKFNNKLRENQYFKKEEEKKKEEKGIFTGCFMNEMDKFRDEVLIYYKLHKLHKNFDKEDIEFYFRVAAEKVVSRPIVEVAWENIRLKIMEEEQLKENIDMVFGRC